jgi:uncharacterized protein YbjT (DUF2867 family)
MKKKRAIVLGSTGLVGSHLVRQLLDDGRFEKVVAFSRRPSELAHPKLDQKIVDFENIADWSGLVKGDVLFSALGTTLKQAGSKAGEYKVDYTYQFQVARAASNNKVPVYVLVSSVGASEKSNIFYTRMKGELDRDVMKLAFEHIHILRPGLLVGKREKERGAEKISFRLIKGLNALGFFTKYKPVHANHVAKAMIKGSFIQGRQVWESKAIFDLLKR